MVLKRIVVVIAVFLCIGVLAGLAHRDFAVAEDIGVGKIENLLADQLISDGPADFIIRFTEQADLSPAFSMDWETRGDFVYHSLLETAESSQVQAKSILDAQGMAYQTFIAGNDLYVFAESQTVNNKLTSSQELILLDQIAVLPEVEFIRATRTYYIDPDVVSPPMDSINWAGDLLADHLLTTVAGPTAMMDWGITDSKADQFWAQFGVKGIGIVVASIDTGVQWNHPALVNQFACPGNPSDPACWDDPSNICGGSACDNYGHGTHTMGTMVAGDNPYLPYIAGMAPDATWIACKGCESNSCSEFALDACADWILAPGGDPANRPNIVNNSWGGGSGDVWYLANVNAWRAAGIFPAFSAGNSGPECGTANTPGDYQETFSSAAHAINREIANFSSRGPSTFGHDPYTKPNISAPGVSICSTVPTDSWSCGYSGTSMASPHTAGAVALLWSCNPSLVGQIDTTFQLLQNNTDPAPVGNCGAPLDGQGNFTYGYGYLDVLQAGFMTCGATDYGTVEGHVNDLNGYPISGAVIQVMPTILDNQIQTYTNPDGYYSMSIPVGTYDMKVSKSNYTSQTISGVEVQAGSVITKNFTLTRLGEWMQINLPAGCPDWTRFDGEYYPADGLVYFLGGRGGADSSQTYGDIYSFNPGTKTCTDTGEDMPEAISNYTISLVHNSNGDVLCTFGGRTSSGGQTLSVQCYNPHTNTAGVVATMPPAWEGYGPYTQVVIDNMVYIFGGFRSNNPPYMLARTEQFDPLTNSFTQKGDLNMARSYIMAAAVDGKIYAFGGDTYDGINLIAQDIAEVFDPTTGTWNDLAVENLPIPSGEGRAFSFNTDSAYSLAAQVILVGGGRWPDDTNEVISYNVATNTYTMEFPNLNIARRDQAGFFVPGDPGMMWVFGGHRGSDIPPYAPPEFFILSIMEYSYYLPLTTK
jgi:subtilisin family serine protease